MIDRLKRVDMRQQRDDSWIIEQTNPATGLIEVEIMPQLGKEQAIREVTQRGYKNVWCWDKRVMEALGQGTGVFVNG